MPRLSDLQTGGLKPITIEYNGLEVALKVDPLEHTLGWQKKVIAAAESDDVDTLSTTFFKVVKEWDIEDDDGNILPLDVTAFDLLTVATFGALSRLIMERMVPKQPTRS